MNLKHKVLTGNPTGNSRCQALASRALNTSCYFGQSARSIESRCVVKQLHWPNSPKLPLLHPFMMWTAVLSVWPIQYRFRQMLNHDQHTIYLSPLYLAFESRISLFNFSFFSLHPRCSEHYIDVIMTTVASQITSLAVFTQLFIQTQMKENIKAPHHWPLCGEFTGTGKFPAQRASYAENVSIWWRHHG